ncbi:unnamed protein product [Alternaria alternata]
MIWYSALLLALAAIATSAQQSVALTRLGSHPDGLCKIRQLIGKRDGLTKFKARKLQLFIWQAPLSLLNTSVVMFIIGFAVLVWKAALPISSGDNVKRKDAGDASTAHFNSPDSLNISGRRPTLNALAEDLKAD